MACQIQYKLELGQAGEVSQIDRGSNLKGQDKQVRLNS